MFFQNKSTKTPTAQPLYENQLSIQEAISQFSIIEENKKAAKQSLLATARGKQALKENLITVQQVEDLSVDTLEILLTENGLKALREKLITPEQAKNILLYLLEFLLTDLGLLTLQKNTIDLNRIIEFCAEILVLSNIPVPHSAEELQSAIDRSEHAYNIAVPAYILHACALTVPMATDVWPNAADLVSVLDKIRGSGFFGQLNFDLLALFAPQQIRMLGLAKLELLLTDAGIYALTTNKTTPKFAEMSTIEALTNSLECLATSMKRQEFEKNKAECQRLLAELKTPKLATC